MSESNKASPAPRAFVPSSVAAAFLGKPDQPGPQLKVAWFTDPLSAWCWGMEPQLLQLTESYGRLLQIAPVMVGLHQSAEELAESDAAFSRADQQAMLWDEVAYLSGMPLWTERWLEAPPSSSWPACVSVKAAQAQDPRLAWRYLRRLREAALCTPDDLADPEVLRGLGAELQAEGLPPLDLPTFDAALEGGAAGGAFEADLALCAQLGAMSAPSFMIAGPGGREVVRGSCPFETLVSAINSAYGGPAPRVANPATVDDRKAYAKALATHRGSITAAELSALCGFDRDTAQDMLDRMASAGALERATCGERDALYRPAPLPESR